uniref:Uncharacterized protein n=1 Tax=Avena sativa TaxID=4498 RepID=A0ACD5UUD2_AVESA
MSSTLLRVSPSELKIPYEVKRQRSCCMQLINKTDKYVAFKVKTTNPRKYSVRHTCGILLPRSSCSVTVTMQAPKEIQLDYHCKDKFLVQSAVARDGATMRDFVPELFTRAPGRLIEEFKLRVVYVAANPPSPVPEEAEEEDVPSASEAMGCEAKITSAFDAASKLRYIDRSGAKLSCAEINGLNSSSVIRLGASVVSTLVGDKVHKVDENHKLGQDMITTPQDTSSETLKHKYSHY